MFQGKGKLAIGGIEKAFDGQMQLYDSDLEANDSHSFEWQLSKRGMLELKIFSDMHMDLEELDVKICIFFTSSDMLLGKAGPNILKEFVGQRAISCPFPHLLYKGV